MPSKKNTDTHMKVLVEAMPRALVWRIDKMKDEMGMNRSNAIVHLLWQGLQADGIVKGRVMSDYDEHLRETVAAQLNS